MFKSLKRRYGEYLKERAKAKVARDHKISTFRYRGVKNLRTAAEIEWSRDQFTGKPKHAVKATRTKLRQLRLSRGY